MKRQALLKQLKKEARARGLDFDLDSRAGKGSHYRVRIGDRRTTVQSGELSPFHVQRIWRQLGLN